MNKIIETILNDEFLLMIIPEYNINPGKSYTQLNPDYKKHKDFDFVNVLDNKYIISMEIKGFGTFFFSNRYDDCLFEKLQRRFKKHRCYVFGANDGYGYFKILTDGKIYRKIASFGELKDGTRSYDEVRGKPCEYEIEKNKIYRLRNGYERLEGFKRPEIFELFDYYIGFDNLKEDSILDIKFYDYFEIR